VKVFDAELRAQRFFGFVSQFTNLETSNHVCRCLAGHGFGGALLNDLEMVIEKNPMPGRWTANSRGIIGRGKRV